MLKFSFVIPSYDSAWCLAHAVASCQEQKWSNLEIIVVDDCSQDSTPELMAYITARDKRVRCIRNASNLGRSASRNIGNQAATGDIIAVLDADDIAYPDRARLTAEKFKKNVDLVYGCMDVIDAVGKRQGILRAGPFDRDKAFRERTFGIVHSSVAVRRELALQYPYEDGEVSALGVDDAVFYARLAASGASFDYVVGGQLNGEPVNFLGAYRVLLGSISKTRDEQKAEAVKGKIFESLHQVSGT